MFAGSRASRFEIRNKRTKCPRYSKKVNQLNWLALGRRTIPSCFVGSLLVVLTSLMVAQSTGAPASGGASVPQQVYTISAQELRVPAKAGEHLKLAHRKFSKSDFAGAETEVDRALLVDPTSAPAFAMRAFLRLAARDLNGAIEAATHALSLDPAEAEAYLALATAYNAQREFQKSEAAAQQVIRMRPDFWQGRLELAKAFYGQGRFVPALHELEVLNRDFPDVHLVRANILLCLNRSDESTKEFAQFLIEAPNDPRREQVMRIVSQRTNSATPASSRQ
jgi:tetratricopeptide (TPR) repeat protein